MFAKMKMKKKIENLNKKMAGKFYMINAHYDNKYAAKIINFEIMPIGGFKNILLVNIIRSCDGNDNKLKNSTIAYNDNEFSEISEDDFKKLSKTSICNCEFGSTPEIIVLKEYDLYNEYSQMLLDIGAEIVDEKSSKEDRKMEYTVIYEGIVIHFKIRYSLNFMKNKNSFFTQKACIKCDTCLDEKQEFHSILKKHFLEIYEQEVKIKHAKMICGVE